MVATIDVLLLYGALLFAAYSIISTLASDREANRQFFAMCIIVIIVCGIGLKYADVDGAIAFLESLDTD